MTVAEAAAKFPATFGLRGFSGEVFRVSLQSSYISEGRVVLYTERQTPEGWLDFAKGSPEELAAQVVAYSMTVVDTAHDQAVAAAAPAAPCRICRGAHPTPERPVAAYGGWCCPTALDEAQARVRAVRYEVDHAGRADWRVVAVRIGSDGVERREWCQTHPTRFKAQASAKHLNDTRSAS